MASGASAAAASEAAQRQAAEPAAKPEDYSCSICFELLLDPVVGEAHGEAGVLQHCVLLLRSDPTLMRTHMLQVPAAMTSVSAA
jgi:hypothetical protein